jgi:hypothetical protein
MVITAYGPLPQLGHDRVGIDQRGKPLGLQHQNPGRRDQPDGQPGRRGRHAGLISGSDKGPRGEAGNSLAVGFDYRLAFDQQEAVPADPAFVGKLGAGWKNRFSPGLMQSLVPS